MESNQYFQNYCDIVQILLDIIEILLDIARYAIVISWVFHKSQESSQTAYQSIK